jgi:hypothetical protein
VGLINDFYSWINLILLAASIALRLWAIVDCAFRKASAFPVANKLTKLAWLSINVISGLLGTVFLFNVPLNPIALVSVVVALVYLTDVRPAVREVSGGSR